MASRTEAATENNRRTSREAKRRRTGTCVDCGAGTSYSGHSEWPMHPNGASLRCPACSKVSTGLKQRGSGHRQRQLVELLEVHERLTYMEIVGHLGTNKNHVGQLLARMRKHGIIVRVGYGVYSLPRKEA
jgi:hypothetical protein